MEQHFYHFTAISLRGQEISMSDYQGKVVIVVNTASKCGFTPQFEGLEALYEKYKDQGLVILGFPCNQFGNQEPNDAAGIEGGCMLNYGVSFPMFSKIEVNGNQAHPIYQYLKQKQKGIFNNDIKWNFTKFVINRSGEPIKRFGSIVSPEKIEKYLLKQGLVK